MNSQPAEGTKSLRARSWSDLLLLVCAGLLVTAAGVGAIAFSQRHGLADFWFWGTWMGTILFIPAAGAVRKRLRRDRLLQTRARRRGFLLYCAGWYPVHMAVMYVLASHLPILVAVVPLLLEIGAGAALARLAFAPRAGG